jgi:large subunit ribosomal protein L17
MCFIELVDYNENMLKDATKKGSKTRRSRKKSTPAAAQPQAVEAEPAAE